MAAEITSVQARWTQTNLAVGNIRRNVWAVLSAEVASSHHRRLPSAAARIMVSCVLTSARIDDAASRDMATSGRLSIWA